jgi:hypothetical protein
MGLQTYQISMGGEQGEVDGPIFPEPGPGPLPPGPTPPSPSPPGPGPIPPEPTPPEPIPPIPGIPTKRKVTGSGGWYRRESEQH